MQKSKLNPFGKECAMFPKVAIEPKEMVEADLGPVIGEDELNCEPGEILARDPREFVVSNGKPTNPKDAIGSNKLPLDLVPSTVELYASLGFLEGALKYGKYNWRVAGVRFSIYLAAIKRHYDKLIDGEWADVKTGVPHLASIIACAGIILDAKLVGKLTDDRPPVAPTADLIASLEAHVPRLKDLFKDHRPHQHTIMDAKEPA